MGDSNQRRKDFKKGSMMSEGRYLYCITNRRKRDYGDIGIDNNRVYSVIYKDMSVVVHDCESRPYESKNVEKVKSWVWIHNYVIKEVMGDKWVVIPFTFDTIINGDEKVLKDWLASAYLQMRKECNRLSGRSEYGVGVYLKPKGIKVDFKGITSGKEYLLKKREEKMVSEMLEGEIAQHRSDIMKRVSGLVTELQTVKPRNIPEGFEDKILVANLSVLVNQRELKELSKQLDKMNGEGFIVRLTGPWPPYSFVDSLEKPKT